MKFRDYFLFRKGTVGKFSWAFPDGVYAAGGLEPVRDFDASSNGRFVQSKDKESGFPLWVVEVIDADAAARTRGVKVKVAAQVQPALPDGPAGVPFTPLGFTGLTVTPYVTQAGKLGYSLKAAGIRAPGHRPAGRRSTLFSNSILMSSSISLASGVGQRIRPRCSCGGCTASLGRPLSPPARPCVLRTCRRRAEAKAFGGRVPGPSGVW